MSLGLSRNDQLPHICYLITNNINGKFYVGVTYKTVDKRFGEHVKVSKSKSNHKTAIGLAIKKYGKENFTISILEKFENKFDAYNAEKKYIKTYNSKINGYNETDGGEGGIIHHIRPDKLVISVLEDFCAGLSLRNIAEKNGISYNSAADICRLRIVNDISQDLVDKVKCRRAASNKRKRQNPDLLNNMFMDFSKNMSTNSLSIKYGYNSSYILCIIKSNLNNELISNDVIEGVKLRLKKFRFHSRDIDESDVKLVNKIINDFINNDMCINNICKAYDLSYHIVIRMLKCVGKFDFIKDSTRILVENKLNKNNK